MISLTISDKIKLACPGLKIATLECSVHNTLHSPELWEEIGSIQEKFQDQYSIEDINKRPEISATREAYKRLGKDPNRYRPSAEALCRRILKDIPLYQINTLVDMINLISIKTGYSIGGFDAGLIESDLILGVGEENEPFEAIGRGTLNIHGLPVYRDSGGGIGTPTSDEERTKIKPETHRLLMIINAYSGENGLQEAVEYSKTLLHKYALIENSDDVFLKMY